MIYEECNDIDQMIKMNITTLPMLQVDGKIINFYDAVNWVKEI